MSCKILPCRPVTRTLDLKECCDGDPVLFSQLGDLAYFRYRLLDEAGNELFGWANPVTEATIPTGTDHYAHPIDVDPDSALQYTVVIGAELNELTPGQRIAGRRIEYQWAIDGQQQLCAEEYFIHSSLPLAVGENTAMTRMQAEIAAMSITGGGDFLAMSDEEKETALMDVYSILADMCFTVEGFTPQNLVTWGYSEDFLINDEAWGMDESVGGQSQSVLGDHPYFHDYEQHGGSFQLSRCACTTVSCGWTYTAWFRFGDLDACQISNLPSKFTSAIARATMAQVIFDSQCDSYEAQREAGITVSRAGNASHSFRSQKPISFALSNTAMKYLFPYIKWQVELHRAG